MSKREPKGASGGRTVPAPRHESDGSDAAGSDAREQAAEERLADTLAQLVVCLDDGQRIVEMGRDRLEVDWVIGRAVKNLIAELGETVGRLPRSFTDDHSEIDWRAIAGMRNRTVHADQHTDYEVVWATLVESFPRLRRALEG